MRTRLFALMTALALLAGCSAGRGSKEKFQNWQSGLKNSKNISFSADIKADFGDKVLQYGARLSWEDEVATVEIKSPESIAGVKLSIRDNGATLEYDGAALELGSLTDAGLSPSSALPEILNALKTGRVLDSRNVREGETKYVVYTLASDSGELSVWFLEEGFTPAAAELSEEGSVRLSCNIHDWKTEDS